MPYITKQRKHEINTLGDRPRSAGDLNYAITCEILNYLGIPEGHGPPYAIYNEVMGVLECAKQELYRRLIAPYEDKKKNENGDVFE